jgi:hypothetical protein
MVLATARNHQAGGQAPSRRQDDDADGRDQVASAPYVSRLSDDLAAIDRSDRRSRC